jgi:putative thioredoxin
LDGLLQQKITALGGAVRLGRLNATVEQELAVALKLTQLPTVIGVYGGRTITSFVGMPADDVIEQFLEIMLRVGGQKQLAAMYGEANAALEKGEVQEAIAKFSEILNDKNLRSEALALAGLIRCYVQEGNIEAAEELVNVIQSSYPKDVMAPEVQQSFSAFELVSKSPKVDSSAIDELKDKIAQNPDDLESRYSLSTALWAASKQEQAVTAALDLVKRDKHWNDQAGRKLLLKYWESLGPDHSLTLSSRKRFGSIWF